MNAKSLLFCPCHCFRFAIATLALGALFQINSAETVVTSDRRVNQSFFPLSQPGATVPGDAIYISAGGSTPWIQQTAGGTSEQFIYDNSLNLLGSRTDISGEIGDVVLLQAGTPRSLTQVQFEYFLSPAARSGDETAQFRLYSTDTTGIPTGLLYNSSVFSLGPTTAAGWGSVTISGINVAVFDQLAWTVEFFGIQSGERAGLIFSNPPLTGSSPTYDPGDGIQHNYYLQHAGGNWTLLDIPGGTTDNLSVRFSGVPEPRETAVVTGGFLLAGLVARQSYRRRLAPRESRQA